MTMPRAEPQSTLTSPWRVTLVAADLNQLVNSDIIESLCPAPPLSLAEAQWIRARPVDLALAHERPSKLEEQHEWIDGTKAMGFEYYLIDDGWKDWNGGGENAWKALGEVVKYARSQGVDIWRGSTPRKSSRRRIAKSTSSTQSASDSSA